jgi:hypothetical protein
VASAGRGCGRDEPLLEHLPWSGDLCHLEGDLAAVAYNFRAPILISSSFSLSVANSLRAAHVQFDAGGGRMTLRPSTHVRRRERRLDVSRRLLLVESRKAAYAQGKQARTAE